MTAPYPMTRLQFSLALAILGAVACNGTIGDSIGLVAGRAGGKFVPKGHVDGGGAHPAQVIISAMRSVGVTGPLGEISQGLSSLGFT